MPFPSILSRGGRWFLRSGIQDPGGGVARYYRCDVECNHAISTEITGYAASTMFWLHETTEQPEYYERGLAAARFLTGCAWDGQAMPFEKAPRAEGQFSYFFDCGIIVRGLLAAWRATGTADFLEVAVALGRSMASDFASHDGTYHPVLKLPDKEPLEPDPLRWSRVPGCYQLKSAMAWWDLFEATGNAQFREPYECVLDESLRSYARFLPGHPDSTKVVDRLHAFLYFLEGLLPRAGEKRCAAALCRGIQRVSQLAQEIAPEFERSDVYAQLLRVRVYAEWAGAAPMDAVAAQQEATTLAAFQSDDRDPRIDGGFYFGRQGTAWLPYINPVSAAFALQALALWEHYRAGGAPVPPRLLI